jgi:hypothetical protein
MRQALARKSQYGRLNSASARQLKEPIAMLPPQPRFTIALLRRARLLDLVPDSAEIFVSLRRFATRNITVYHLHQSSAPNGHLHARTITCAPVHNDEK